MQLPSLFLPRRDARGRFLLPLCVALAMSACSGDKSPDVDVPIPAPAPTPTLPVAAPSAASSEQESLSWQRLTQVLGEQSDARKARYDARNPKETLSFFGVKPGMTVLEALPEGGWYSHILSEYLGSAGHIIGADYDLNMYPLFGFYSDDELAAKATWAERWPQELAVWAGEGAAASAFNFGSMSNSMRGRADVVLFVRALHNLSVFEPEGAYLSTALKNAYDVLKPGGSVGVVQHMGPDEYSEAWSTGVNGYLKKANVVRAFEQAGFVFTGESAVNTNPLDQPSEDEYVWRLPPTLEETEDPEQNARYASIGESNRMTLLFKKPDVIE